MLIANMAAHRLIRGVRDAGEGHLTRDDRVSVSILDTVTSLVVNHAASFIVQLDH